MPDARATFWVKFGTEFVLRKAESPELAKLLWFGETILGLETSLSATKSCGYACGRTLVTFGTLTEFE